MSAELSVRVGEFSRHACIAEDVDPEARGTLTPPNRAMAPPHCYTKVFPMSQRMPPRFRTFVILTKSPDHFPPSNKSQFNAAFYLSRPVTAKIFANISLERRTKHNFEYYNLHIHQFSTQQQRRYLLIKRSRIRFLSQPWIFFFLVEHYSRVCMDRLCFVHL